MDQTWILCRSKPNQQKYAIENVARVRPDYECYLPRFFDPDTRKVLFMYGTYMFVRIIDGQWHCLRGIWGMANVLTNTEGAQVVPDRDINKIRAMEDKHGVVKLNVALQLGAEVTIVAGPLRFIGGKFIKHSRRGYVRVALDMLGKETSVELEEKIVSPV